MNRYTINAKGITNQASDRKIIQEIECIRFAYEMVR